MAPLIHPGTREFTKFCEGAIVVFAARHNGLGDAADFGIKMRFRLGWQRKMKARTVAAELLRLRIKMQARLAHHTVKSAIAEYYLAVAHDRWQMLTMTRTRGAADFKNIFVVGSKFHRHGGLNQF